MHAVEIEHSLAYLASDAALVDVTRDAYWPKWHSPWWHMLCLHEMGETKRIPKRLIDAYVATLARIPLKIFPIQPADMPEGVDPYRGTPCHCQLGTAYQVLATWGVDVDQALPWIRPWFLRYQMADGGLTCDNDAYLVKDECPSSMVGTIGAFEAVLLHTPRPWTADERTFLDRAAQFLSGRQLRLGSDTKHNAAERESAEQWSKLCFPRFYFYDVLRGLIALTRYAEKTGATLPPEATRHVVSDLARRFPDGQIRVERRGYEDTGTIQPTATGEWIRRQPATFFPLLTAVSEVGVVSPYLSRHWAAVRP